MGLKTFIEALNKFLGIVLSILQSRRQKKYEDDMAKIKSDPNAAFNNMFGDGRLHQPGGSEGQGDLSSDQTSVDKPTVSERNDD